MTRKTSDGTPMKEAESVLARGLVSALARRGWRRDHTGRRLWERHPAPALHVTSAGWAVVAGETAVPRSLGDELVAFLAWRAGAKPAGLLCRLGGAALDLAPDFAPLFTPAGACVLDALQGDLADAWVAAERAKAEIREPQTLAARGDDERAVLDAFLGGVPRRELARFVLDACARIDWSPGAGLDPDAPLSDRRDARRRAAGLLDAMRRWRRWHDEHRAVGFVDDGFAEAQALLALWRPEAWSRAQAALAELERL